MPHSPPIVDIAGRSLTKVIPTWHRNPQILPENTPNSKIFLAARLRLRGNVDFITKGAARELLRRIFDFFTKQNSKPSINHSLTSKFWEVLGFWGTRNSELFELMRSYWADTRTARRRPSHTDQYELMNISKLSRDQVKSATHSQYRGLTGPLARFVGI